MSLILNIDTSSKKGLVSISLAGGTLHSIQNDDQHEHASFLQPAIKKLLSYTHYAIHDVSAVAVVNGPGSYTGLRVGLASAKGICFAIDKPLIAINSLYLMAAAMSNDKDIIPSNTFLCPMIDARRQEVFTAMYTKELGEEIAPTAMILTPDSLSSYLDKNEVIFFGDGAVKWRQITTHQNARFHMQHDTNFILGKIADNMYNDGQFCDLAYVEPFYLKSFFNG